MHAGVIEKACILRKTPLSQPHLAGFLGPEGVQTHPTTHPPAPWGPPGGPGVGLKGIHILGVSFGVKKTFPSHRKYGKGHLSGRAPLREGTPPGH